MSRSPCLKVPKVFGEKALQLVRELELLNRRARVHRVKEQVCIPLTQTPRAKDVRILERHLSEFEISTCQFTEHSRGSQPTLPGLLEHKIPQRLFASLPRAVDFVGDLAIVEVPAELKEYEQSIGEAVLKVHKRVNAVLSKGGAVEGPYRIRKFTVIAGAKKTSTVHREHGCGYHVDLAKAYFSPRLSHEHNRVASQVRPGETVVDMFAGVGPFTILIAKRQETVQIFAVDMNPEAMALLKQNIVLNHVADRVTPILGDVRTMGAEQLGGVADRVIMNLPETAIEHVDSACKMLKSQGGIIHYYEFAQKPTPLKDARDRLAKAIGRAERRVKRFLVTKKVRETAPFTWQVVLDAEIH